VVKKVVCLSVCVCALCLTYQAATKKCAPSSITLNNEIRTFFLLFSRFLILLLNSIANLRAKKIVACFGARVSF